MSTIEDLKKAISDSECIVIGAGSGLSTAAGFQYGGQVFLDNFKRMHDLYGYTDMYTAGFHHFSTSEEKWGYWSKFIYLNRYKEGAKSLYLKLKEIVSKKDYFVITTNVDHQFQLAGFDKDRLFYTQGDYGLFQCSKACHDTTYDNKDIILQMIKEEKEGRIPSYLVPRCPVCGEEMDVHLRKDEFFVENEGYRKARDRYYTYLKEHQEKRILFLELGVGFNTPVIIKFPFWKMTYGWKNARYACLNLNNAYAPYEIEDKSIVISGDISDTLEKI